MLGLGRDSASVNKASGPRGALSAWNTGGAYMGEDEEATPGANQVNLNEWSR